IASRKRVLMRVAAAISSRETPRISRSRRRCSPKGVEDIRWDQQKYRRRLVGCQCCPGSNAGGAEIGVSAIETECRLRQVKMVHYNGKCCFPNTKTPNHPTPPIET